MLDAFLRSASKVLNPDGGQIQVALCEGQGGATASTHEEWKQSWTAALFAAEHNLLLFNVEPYMVRLVPLSLKHHCAMLFLQSLSIPTLDIVSLPMTSARTEE